MDPAACGLSFGARCGPCEGTQGRWRGSEGGVERWGGAGGGAVGARTALGKALGHFLDDALLALVGHALLLSLVCLLDCLACVRGHQRSEERRVGKEC